MRIAVAGATGTVGRHVVEAARSAGHETVALARSVGVDVRTGAGLDAALDGADAVVDVLSIPTLNGDEAAAFFRATATNLLAAAERQGVGHAVLLSIVGVDRNPYAYYAGKVAEEEVFAAASVPWSILRATQFHEFAAQMLDRAKAGPLRLAPRARTQPIAAREVGEHLAALASGPARGRVTDLAGPREEELSAMVKAYARAAGHRGPVFAVTVPGAQMKGMRAGANLPGPGAVLGRQTFDEWLTEVRAAHQGPVA